MNEQLQVRASSAPHWVYWGESMSNLVRMGHCAPTVMQTILEASDSQKEWLVRLISGMPGGIGNTGFECGAVTAPLVLMGLRYGLRETDRGLPVIVDRGHDLYQRFLACHKTLACKQIRGRYTFPIHCIRPVCLAPQLYFASTGTDNRSAILAASREAYCCIYSFWAEQNFHCARAVLEQLAIPAEQVMLDAVSAFMGGTLFMGMTCSAFAAGVMAV